LHIADVIDGTFYGLFSSLNGSGDAPNTYLVTSAVSSGTTWTLENSGNPVLAGVFCASQIAKISGTYYMWGNANQPGQGNSDAPNYDPLEGVRYSSTNLTSWAFSSKSIHNTGMAESLNSNLAGVYPTALINGPSGNALMFYVGSPGDAASVQIYQCCVAVGPAPLVSIVTQPETAWQQVASDAFTSGDGNLDSNWTALGSYQIPQIVSSGTVQAKTAGAVSAAYYSGAAFNANQYSSITLEALGGTNNQYFALPTVRCQIGAESCYVVNLTGPAGSGQTAVMNISVKVAGVTTIIYKANTVTPQVGDVWTLECITGADGFPQLSVYQNGFLVARCEDYANTFTSGYPGILLYATTTLADAEISAWAGGNANVIPTYPSSSSGSSWMNLALASGGPRHGNWADDE
jgi:hypothetical protein